MNKKAFTLSVNFLVTMIIMVILFGFGIYLFTTIFNQAVTLDDQVHQREIDNLNKVMDNGDIVTLLQPQQTSDGNPLRFPIGISNENTENANDRFKVIIQTQDLEGNLDCNYNFIPNDGSINPTCTEEVVLTPADFESGFNIDNNERTYRLIVVDPKHYHGFYTIKLRVLRNDQEYGKLQMIWVTVP